MRIDFVLVKCKSCGVERKLEPPAPITGAAGLTRFLDANGRCECGGVVIDVRAHVVTEN